VEAARQHGELLHGHAHGHVVIGQKLPHAQCRWRQRAYKVADLPDVLAELVGQEDTFFSQASFYGYKRNLNQLAGIAALWGDVDFHTKPQLAGMHPLGVVEEALILLERAKIPVPSLAIGSGRGLYLLWLHGLIPRAALPRWNLCQERINEALLPLGADAAANDAARVLRLVGTVNSKSGVVVEALRPPGEVWSFDDLADEILPYTREEYAEVRDLRIARAKRRPDRKLWTPLHRLNVASLMEGRLADLQLLLRLRWDADEAPPGQRDKWMLVAGTSMSWLAPNTEVRRREARELAREAAAWAEGETQTRLYSVIQRAVMAERGEKVSYGSKEVDPRYRFKTQTIMDWLEIDAAEEPHMRVLISKTEKERRRAEKRRQAGMVPQWSISATATDKRTEAIGMATEGRSFEEIAAAVGRSVHTVKSYVYGRR
jgi:hypothetical protein